MKVEALRRGFYGSIREVGDVFEINSEKDLGKWMKPLESESNKPAKKDGSKDDGGSTLKAGEIVKAIEESDDIEFIQSHADSSFATVKKAVEARLEELRG